MQPIHTVALVVLICLGFFLGLVGCQDQMARSRAKQHAEPIAAQSVIPVMKTAVPLAPPVATIYTVKAGDTLSEIAEQHYGKWRAFGKIAYDNKLKDPNKIYPGDQIKLYPT